MSINMGYRIETINPSTDKRWDDFVRNHPKGSVYHHSAWINLIEATFPYRTHCYAKKKKKTERFKGLLPFMASSGLLKKGHLVSLPYAAYCDPLLPTGKLGESLEYVIRNQPGGTQVELKLSTDLEDIPLSFKKESTYVNHSIDLSGDINTLFDNLHKSCIRRKIKTAQKHELMFCFSDCEEDIKKIYDLLLSMRKTKGLPPHPYKFFFNMWKLLGPLKMFFAPYVTYQNKVIAAAIVLKFKDSIYYEYGASDPAFKNLGSNQYLLWEIMKFGHENGAQVFELGRTHSENDSLVEFKDRWGSVKSDLTYCYYPKGTGIKKTNDALKAFGMTLNKRLPESILRFEGEFLFRFLR